MLKTLSVVPMMIVPAFIYTIITPWTKTGSPAAVWNLVSGDTTVVTVGDIIVFLGIIALGVEVVKATRMSAWGMADHVASLVLLLVMMIAYVAVYGFGNTVWLILCAMQVVDVAIGVIVSVSVARRDFGGGLPFIGGGDN